MGKRVRLLAAALLVWGAVGLGAEAASPAPPRLVVRPESGPVFRRALAPGVKLFLAEGVSQVPGAEVYRLWIEAGADVASLDPVVASMLPEERSRVRQLKIVSRNSDAQPLDLAFVRHLPALDSIEVSRGPVVGFSNLAAVQSLRKLQLWSASLSDLESLRGLTQVQRLNLIMMKVPSLEPLSGMRALRELELEQIELADQASLATLRQVETLEISGLKLASLEPVVSLPRLTSLRIVGNPVADWSPLASMTGLTALAMRGADADYGLIAPLTELRSLELSASKRPFSNFELFAQLPEIQSLKLDWIRVDDLGLFAKNRNLKLLHISVSHVTDLTPLAALPDLEDFSLNGALDFRDLAALEGAPKLRVLRLSGNGPGTVLRDASALARLTALEHVNLQGTKVSDISFVLGLPRLRHLSVADSPISSLEPLRGASQLERLDIEGTLVRDLNPLDAMPALRRVRLPDGRDELRPVAWANQK